MDDREQLIVANLLNGVPAATVAATFGEEEAEIMAIFALVTKLVAEYRLVHCVPHFDCGTIAEARGNKLRVLDVLGRIARWDAIERDLMLDLLKGKDVAGYGVERGEIQAMLERTLNALPNYLGKEDLPAYLRDRKAFIANRRARVIEAVEKFVSGRNPLIYKKIEHLGMDQANVDQVVRMVTH